MNPDESDASTIGTVKNSGRGRQLTQAQEQVLRVLVDQPDLVGVEAVARHLGKHTNTVREQLTALVAAGLAERHRSPSQGRGRPAWLYGAVQTARMDDNAELAAALAWRIAHHEDDPAESAKSAGRHWGRTLAAERALSRQPDARGARRQVIAVFDELGYHPEADGGLDRITLRRCPLLQVASVIPEVVCAVHLGMAEELAEIAGEDPARVSLRPFVAPGSCLLRLHGPAAS